MDDASLDLQVVMHPVVQSRMAVLRDESTPNGEFRTHLTKISQLLIYEALAGEPTAPIRVRTPVGPADGVELAGQPLFVPVLRAGLGMLDAALSLVPDAQVGFVGVARDEETALPHEYLASLPEDLAGRHVYVLDPMLATGGSLIYTLEILARRGATDVTAVCVVGAPEGVAALRDSGHAGPGRTLRLVIGAVDAGLNEDSYIVPGLGDAGDRQFGPRNI
ncbi:MAG: uracil phosphoribosyltransferase [Gordonia sp. (in: high G+C Gram-positive bacteria)]|uniref:uracil phosphoribosyltransferase n=1 Tax=Gordonia sp. (in: high G+C Gram-positive bacteria) TaxID=84139 RepID=UPI0039E32F0A